MNKRTRFSFRMNSVERQMIFDLAGFHQRSQSDMLRILVQNAHKEMIQHGVIYTQYEKMLGDNDELLLRR